MSELTGEELAAVAEARRVLLRSLERQFPARLAGILAAVAIAGQFADLVAASSGKTQLIDVCNAELARVGLQLSPTARH